MDVTGHNNPHYDFPEGSTCLADLTDHMGYNQGNILKAGFRWGEKPDLEYNLKKIIYFANRELRRLEQDGGQEGGDLRQPWPARWMEFSSNEFSGWGYLLDLSGLPRKEAK